MIVPLGGLTRARPAARCNIGSWDADGGHRSKIPTPSWLLGGHEYGLPGRFPRRRIRLALLLHQSLEQRSITMIVRLDCRLATSRRGLMWHRLADMWRTTRYRI